MGKIEHRILKKLDEWTAAGLISTEQAEAIRVLEAAPSSSVPWGIAIFAGFGAVVLGLGVILLFAYNWDQMHKFAKLALVFGALAAAHGAGILLRRSHRPKGFSDAAFLSGTMLFGAGIWLIAQIYHISAHYPNAFIVWAAGALMLAWVLPSVSQGLLASVLISAWACCEAVSYDNHLAAAPMLVIVGAGWLAWKERSPVLLAGASVSFVVSAAVGLGFNWECVLPVLLGTALMLASAAWLVRDHEDFPSAARVLRGGATIVYLPLLFILTFHDAAGETLPDSNWQLEQASWTEWIPPGFLLLAVCGLAATAFQRASVEKLLLTREFRNHLLAPALLFAVYLTAWCALLRINSQSTTKEVAATVICLVANSIFIYHMVTSLWTGCRETLLRRVVAGSLMLAVWIFARFADLFESLLARGAMFMVMGAALFAVAVIYHRKKKHAEANLNPAKEH